MKDYYRYVLALAILIGLALTSLLAMKPQEFTKSFKDADGLPDVVVIRHELVDSAQVCAESLTGGMAACRSVGEFRKWVAERPLVKKK